MTNLLSLGRRIPTDFVHVDRFPLTASSIPGKPVPVVLGVNWYTNFDNPVLSGKEHWIGKGDLGQIRGGHCVCLLPRGLKDNLSWWEFYNQGKEGACVGFGSSRMMSLLNRKRYNARWLWDRAKEVDDWPDTNPGDDNGTSVRAAMDILRTKGHVLDKHQEPELIGGIATNRWATNAQQVLDALGTPSWDHVRVLNSWGTSYPHIVNLTASTLDRLIQENGEATLVTDL